MYPGTDTVESAGTPNPYANGKNLPDLLVSSGTFKKSIGVLAAISMLTIS